MELKYHTERFNEIRPFELFVNYSEITRAHPKNTHDSHIHKEWEIYVNLAGDISFEVDDRIYSVEPGDIIISRPYEYHHCIYHNDKIHKFFWILFSSEGNEFLYNSIHKKAGESGHRFSLPKNKTEELIAVCHELTEVQPSEATKYGRFFKLIELLQDANTTNDFDKALPADILFAVDYISTNFSYPISINKLAKEANVSVNTLERHFAQSFGLSPREYIKKKRLANAAKLLSEGHTVASASEHSGFSDYSNFIANFKKYYKMTPFKYKKTLEK